MSVPGLKPALVSLVSALAASLYCLLPLAVIVLGLGSGAFMAATIRYQTILLPLGILGVATAYVLCFLERRCCRLLACRMAGSRLNAIMLGVATVILVGELVMVAFPRTASELFTQAMASSADRMPHIDAEEMKVAVDPEKKSVGLDHDESKGLMSPMTKTFRVESPALLQGVTPSDRVTVQLRRTPKSLSVVALTQEAPAGVEHVVLDVHGMS